MKLPHLTGFALSVAGTLFLMVAAAVPAHGQSGAEEGVTLAGLTEKNLPAAEMPSPTATPTPAAPGAEEASPQASPPSVQPSPAPTPEAVLPPVGATPGAQAQGAPTPPPPPAAPAPPLDIGALRPESTTSNASLEPEIRDAQSPSMAASLRVVDQARREILSNNPDDAIHMLTYALSIDAQDSYTYFYLGRAWLLKKNYSQAVTFFKRAEIGFNSNPRWLSETLAFEGLAYETTGDTGAAAAAYRRAVETEPGNLMARVGYGRLSAETGETAPTSAEPAPAPAGSEAEPPPEESPAGSPPEAAPPEPID